MIKKSRHSTQISIRSGQEEKWIVSITRLDPSTLKSWELLYIVGNLGCCHLITEDMGDCRMLISNNPRLLYLFLIPLIICKSDIAHSHAPPLFGRGGKEEGKALVNMKGSRTTMKGSRNFFGCNCLLTKRTS